MANVINVIHPYKYGPSWVFDDESRGLDKEPFVSGADSIIEAAASILGVVDPEHGFKLIFSGGPFPGYNLKAEWQRQDEYGAPREIYARFEAR